MQTFGIAVAAIAIFTIFFLGAENARLEKELHQTERDFIHYRSGVNESN